MSGLDEGNAGTSAGSVGDITALLNDKQAWDDILDLLAETIQQPRLLQRMVEKDLYVTEAIRHAIVPSDAFPNLRTVFKGGTSLAKAYPILRRFSEDVDVNIIPPPDQEFGQSRRVRARRELHARLDAGIPLEVEHVRMGTNFATSTFTYTSVEAAQAWEHQMYGLGFGRVLVEMNIREQPAGMFEMRPVSSLAGEAAAELGSAYLDRHPFLHPFEVLTADPMVAVVDKLDALNWRGASDDPAQVASRARDIYDLACLLEHEAVKPKINRNLVAEMHEVIVESIPPGISHRATPRPDGGFAEAAAFQPGHPACEALRAAYPSIQQMAYSDSDWVEFDKAIGIIRSNSHLI